MAVRMVHPLHGVTHAVGSEVDWNKANGWRVDENPVAVAVPEEKAAVEIIEQSPAEKYEAKFGKPPHHRMKPETIEAALKE